MQRLFAIIGLTWKAAFRYRLFWVIVTLLMGAVVGLPLLIKHDGTADGFAQILITYTLGAVTALLGLCTLWLACGTLARDIEECQLQLVLVKPIGRWQVWLGKWLGLVTLNAVLLAVAGGSVYGLIEWRARGLSDEELVKLRNQVLVARASARPASVDQAIDTETRKRLQDLIEKKGLGNASPDAVASSIRDKLKAEVQVVPPDQTRPWQIHIDADPSSLKGQALYLRVKFNTSAEDSSKTFYANWIVANPQTKEYWPSEPMSLAPDTFHEFPVPADLVDDKGDVVIFFHNPNTSSMLFPLSDGMEVLYRVGGFAPNLIRGLGIILCWMALLAALGLAAASFLSFPVAAFLSLAVLTMGLCSGTLSNVVSEGTVMGTDPETGAKTSAAVDNVMVPVFRSILDVIDLVQQFSPVDSLSTGRNVSWTELGRAGAEIVLLLGGILGSFGIFVFHRRELATAAVTHQ
jgi:hypothetical protein